MWRRRVITPASNVANSNSSIYWSIVAVSGVFLLATQLFWARAIIPQSTTNGAKEPVDRQNVWKDVRYHSGVFGNESEFTEEERIIRKQCRLLIGDRRFRKEDNPNANKKTCFGPLVTNITCCYCFFSDDVEELHYTAGRYKRWSCAEQRNFSLEAPNRNGLDTQGGRIVWMTGKFGFGDRFKDEVNEYCEKVKTMRLFESQDAFCYWDSPKYVLEDKRFQRHLKFRSDPDDLSSKGGGFWFHKAVILRHHMDRHKDGDFLVWTDDDLIHFFAFGGFNAAMGTMTKAGDDICVEVLGKYREKAFTKEDMLSAFNASSAVRESPQIAGGLVVVRNSPQMKRFIDAWIDCVADWHMVSDDPSLLPNGPEFVAHRHDQSILSLLMKTFMTKEAVVGPPARPYQHLAEITTFKLRHSIDPKCPFSSSTQQKH